jgi:hypothetical protein
MGTQALLILSGVAIAVAQSPPSPYWPFAFGPSAAGLPKFRASRFGLFIHWGPCSQWGSEISFPLTCPGLPCSSQGPNGSSVTITTVAELAAHRAAYSALAGTFNPSQFNPTVMATLAYNAGFRYMTWVATHCDGFSNWNSTGNKNYSIVSTPYGRDTFGMAHAAFSAAGLRVGAYVCPVRVQNQVYRGAVERAHCLGFVAFLQSFWNRDDYFSPSASTAFGTCCQPNYDPVQQPETWASFLSYLHAEVCRFPETVKLMVAYVSEFTFPYPHR